jgi:acetyl esterase/lipase
MHLGKEKSMLRKTIYSVFLCSLIFISLISLYAGSSKEKLLYPDGIRENPVIYEKADSVEYKSAHIKSISGLNRKYSHVMIPTYTITEPEPNNNKGIGFVICPGGGYREVWFDREGYDLALYLKDYGITSLTLKYRTNSNDKNGNRMIDWEKYMPAVLNDAQEALRVLHKNTETLKLDENKIGIGGFSAGGNLSLMTCFAADSIDNEARPDFVCLFYPGFPNDYEKQIYAAKQLPPMFIINGFKDTKTPVNNCFDLCNLLYLKGVPTELHIYSNGGHGFDMGYNKDKGESIWMWKNSLVAWFKDIGMMDTSKEN